jgi:hypothetical protein
VGHVPNTCPSVFVFNTWDTDMGLGVVLCKARPQVPKSCVTMEDPTTVTLVRTSIVLVMEEVLHKGGFPGDLKGSK